jgi:hypothetical protein
MQRIELGSLEHTVERAWAAQPVQDRMPMIRIGKLARGGWWVERHTGYRWAGAWACEDELQAEAVAERWSRKTGLRWRQVDPALASPS